MDILKVENLSYWYGDKQVIDNISFSIKGKMAKPILSSNNSCKTTLIKTLSGILPVNYGKIVVNGIELNRHNFKKYILYISTILDDIEDQFICNTVKDELEYPLKNLKYKKSHIIVNTQIVCDLLKISKIYDKRIDSLTYFEKIKVLIAASIMHKPKILFVDDILRFLNKKEKSEILKLFNIICDELDISILFTTSNLMDVKDMNNITVINEGKIVMNDSFEKIILKENELIKMGIEIPVMIDLSRKLQLYNLLDKIYYDENKVVNRLWK